MTVGARVSDARYAVCEGVVARKVKDEIILLNLQTGAYFSLNGVGAIIWSCVDARMSLDAAAAAVVDEYEIALDDALPDVYLFLARLLDLGLVERR